MEWKDRFFYGINDWVFSSSLTLSETYLPFLIFNTWAVPETVDTKALFRGPRWPFALHLSLATEISDFKFIGIHQVSSYYRNNNIDLTLLQCEACCTFSFVAITILWFKLIFCFSLFIVNRSACNCIFIMFEIDRLLRNIKIVVTV